MIIQLIRVLLTGWTIRARVNPYNKNVGAFHGGISLNCHSNEYNRMTFQMTTTTHVYCPIACNGTSKLHLLRHPTICDAKSLHAIDENNSISNMLEVFFDLFHMQIIMILLYCSSLTIARNGSKVQNYNISKS